MNERMDFESMSRKRREYTRDLCEDEVYSFYRHKEKSGIEGSLFSMNRSLPLREKFTEKMIFPQFKKLRSEKTVLEQCKSPHVSYQEKYPGTKKPTVRLGLANRSFFCPREKQDSRVWIAPPDTLRGSGMVTDDVKLDEEKACIDFLNKKRKFFSLSEDSTLLHSNKEDQATSEDICEHPSKKRKIENFVSTVSNYISKSHNEKKWERDDEVSIYKKENNSNESKEKLSSPKIWNSSRNPIEVSYLSMQKFLERKTMQTSDKNQEKLDKSLTAENNLDNQEGSLRECGPSEQSENCTENFGQTMELEKQEAMNCSIRKRFSFKIPSSEKLESGIPIGKGITLKDFHEEKKRCYSKLKTLFDEDDNGSMLPSSKTCSFHGYGILPKTTVASDISTNELKKDEEKSSSVENNKCHIEASWATSTADASNGTVLGAKLQENSKYKITQNFSGFVEPVHDGNLVSSSFSKASTLNIEANDKPNAALTSHQLCNLSGSSDKSIFKKSDNTIKDETVCLMSQSMKCDTSQKITPGTIGLFQSSSLEVPLQAPIEVELSLQKSVSGGSSQSSKALNEPIQPSLNTMSGVSQSLPISTSEHSKPNQSSETFLSQNLKFDAVKCSVNSTNITTQPSLGSIHSVSEPSQNSKLGSVNMPQNATSQSFQSITFGTSQPPKNLCLATSQESLNMKFGSSQLPQNATSGTVQTSQNTPFATTQSSQKITGITNPSMNTTFGTLQSSQSLTCGTTQSSTLNFNFGASQAFQSSVLATSQPSQNAAFFMAQPTCDSATGTTLQSSKVEALQPPGTFKAHGTSQLPLNITLGTAQPSFGTQFGDKQTSQNVSFGTSQQSQNTMFGTNQASLGAPFGTSQSSHNFTFGTSQPSLIANFGSSQPSHNFTFGTSQPSQNTTLVTTQPSLDAPFGNSQQSQSFTFGTSQPSLNTKFGVQQPSQNFTFGTSQPSQNTTLVTTQPSFSTPFGTSQPSQIFTFGTSQPSLSTNFGLPQPPQGFTFGTTQPSQSTILGVTKPSLGTSFGTSLPSSIFTFGTTQASQSTTQPSLSTTFGTLQSLPNSMFGTTQPSTFGPSQPPLNFNFGTSKSSQSVVFGIPQTSQIATFASTQPSTSLNFTFGASQASQNSLFGSSHPTQLNSTLGNIKVSQNSAFGNLQPPLNSTFGTFTSSHSSTNITPQQPLNFAFGNCQASQNSFFGSSQPSQNSVLGTSKPPMNLANGATQLSIDFGAAQTFQGSFGNSQLPQSSAMGLLQKPSNLTFGNPQPTSKFTFGDLSAAQNPFGSQQPNQGLKIDSLPSQNSIFGAKAVGSSTSSDFQAAQFSMCANTNFVAGSTGLNPDSKVGVDPFGGSSFTLGATSAGRSTTSRMRRKPRGK